MDIEKELTHVAFLNREYQVSHLAYDREMAFFKAIQRGDLETVHRLFKPLDSDKMGTLSQNPLRNLTYHFIITVASSFLPHLNRQSVTKIRYPKCSPI